MTDRVDATDAGHGGELLQAGNAWVFPKRIEDVSSEWLIDVLQRANPGTQIRTARQERIIWGTATKIFFEIEYHSGDPSELLRASICVKGAFDERMREYFTLSVIYTTEAAFYRDIASHVDLVLPACWLAIEDREEGIIALEDLGKAGATFGLASDQWSAEEAAVILRQLANLHAHCWGWREGRFPWLTLGSGAHRQGLWAMLDDNRYSELSARPEIIEFRPTAFADAEVIFSALKELWRTDDLSDELTVCHGDAHLGQTFILPDGRRGLLDWQGVAVMPWAKDVSYFLSGALGVADRRAHERDLLELYLNALERAGGPRLDRNNAWLQYRRQMLNGVVWPVVIEDMQPLEAICAMTERCFTAMSDLGTLDAIWSR